MEKVANRIDRSIGMTRRSFAKTFRRRRNRTTSPNLDRVYPSCGRFAQVFFGEPGFAQLKKHAQRTNEMFKEIIAVLEERAELENLYSREMQKFAARLEKTTKTSNGCVDSSWRHVATIFAGEATVHGGLAESLTEEIIKPLRTVYDSDCRSKKSVESAVERDSKRLIEKRTAQLKLKRQTHGLTKELERVQRQRDEDATRLVRMKSDKQIAKLEAKRQKLESVTRKSEQGYCDAATMAEVGRLQLDQSITNAVNRVEQLEEHRIANLQTALGRFRRRVLQLAPQLTQVYQQNMALLEDVTTMDVRNDLDVIAAKCQPRQLCYKSLTLCDFYSILMPRTPRKTTKASKAKSAAMANLRLNETEDAEDFSQIMNPERRKAELERLTVLFQTAMEKERKESIYSAGRSLSERQESVASIDRMTDSLRDTGSIKEYLEFHLYKLQNAVNAVDNKGAYSETSPPTVGHPLARYQERNKDKSGLRQTFLQIPLFTNAEDLPSPIASGSSRAVKRAESSDGYLDDDYSMRSTVDSMTVPYRQEGDGQSNCHYATRGTRPAPPAPSTIDEDREAIYSNIDEHSPPPLSTSSSVVGGPRLIAVHSYRKQRSDEIDLYKGETLRLLREVSDDWWEGRVLSAPDRMGLFPANHVIRIDTAVVKESN